MTYAYRRHHHVHAWQLPFVGLWLMLAGCAWITVWSTVWCYEIYIGATVRAYRTTRGLFGWPR